MTGVPNIVFAGLGNLNDASKSLSLTAAMIKLFVSILLCRYAGVGK